jgi:glycosyltransferase involved in cell wall biosynthesis
MSSNLQISAVIPAFNREKTIGRAVESVLAQDFVPEELLVVDDGSQDSTVQVAAKCDRSVRLIKQLHSGVAAARNRGVREAKFNWIAFLDSDDYWLPGHLRRMAEAIEATKGEAAVYFSDLRYSEGNHPLDYWERCGFQPKAPFEFRRDASDWAMMRIQPMMFQASVVSRQHYLKSGALPESLRTREDTLMFFKLGLLHPMCAVAGCGTVMTADGGKRLTDELDSRSIGYCRASISVYTHLLAMTRSVGHSQQKLFEDALCLAFFSMARAAYREKLYGTSLAYLLRSGLRNPKVCAGCLAGKLRRLAIRSLERGDLLSSSKSSPEAR